MKKAYFIHGMFQNDKSWENWVDFFSKQGYNSIAKPWPLHEGEPAHLRAHVPAGLGDLRLETIIDKFKAIIGNDKDAILVGHSVGGLIVQKLINEGIGSAGVCISSVAPNRMLSFDWGFFKNSITIANPFAGDEPFYMTPEAFKGSFANTLSEPDLHAYYEATATHDSRNVLRDCMLETGHIELEKTKNPLLFIAGEKDEIIPFDLCEKNAKAYSDNGTIADYKKFDNRSHFICNEPGWEEVANYTLGWIEKIKGNSVERSFATMA